MRKFLATILCIGTILGATLAPALAENFTYKLYDPKVNKNYSAQVITLSISDTTYTLGLFAEQNVCAIIPTTMNTNPNTGLVGGDCVGVAGTESGGKKFNWREYSPNTFYPEMQSIINERAQQGKSLAK